MEPTDDSAICRLCLKGGSCLVYIFQEHAGQMYVPAEVIRNFLRIQVLESDGYPPYICVSCFDKLTDIKLFREQCLQSRLTYDSLRAAKTSRQTCLKDELERCSSPYESVLQTDPDQISEPLVEIKKEAEDDSIDDEEDAEIPLDIVKTELEEDVNYEESVEGASLTQSGGDFEEENQQQDHLTEGPGDEDKQDRTQRWAFSGIWDEEHDRHTCNSDQERRLPSRTSEHPETLKGSIPWRQMSLSQDGFEMNKTGTISGQGNVPPYAGGGCSKIAYVPGFTFKFAEEMGNRLWKDRVRQARRRAMETPEERQRRLAQDRERTRLRRANETPEEKARRLERARIYMAQKRRRLMTLVELEQGTALAYQARMLQEQSAGESSNMRVAVPETN